MSVQGKSWLISIIHKRIIVKEIQDRILSSKMWDSEEIIFIDNVNLHKTLGNVEVSCFVFFTTRYGIWPS